MAERKFDLSELRTGNICKQKAKWHIALNESKSKNMRRFFEASSIMKCDKDKGNENVIWFNWNKCFSLKNKNLGILIFAVFVKTAKFCEGETVNQNLDTAL